MYSFNPFWVALENSAWVKQREIQNSSPLHKSGEIRCDRNTKKVFSQFSLIKRNRISAVKIGTHYKSIKINERKILSFQKKLQCYQKNSKTIFTTKDLDPNLLCFEITKIPYI